MNQFEVARINMTTNFIREIVDMRRCVRRLAASVIFEGLIRDRLMRYAVYMDSDVFEGVDAPLRNELMPLGLGP
jgi:hypothetical protein